MSVFGLMEAEIGRWLRYIIKYVDCSNTTRFWLVVEGNRLSYGRKHWDILLLTLCSVVRIVLLISLHTNMLS